MNYSMVVERSLTDRRIHQAQLELGKLNSSRPNSEQKRFNISDISVLLSSSCRAQTRLHKEKSHEIVALFGDRTQPAVLPAGLLRRNQTDIAGHLPARSKRPNC